MQREIAKLAERVAHAEARAENAERRVDAIFETLVKALTPARKAA